MKPIAPRILAALIVLCFVGACGRDGQRALAVSGQIEGRTVTAGSALGGRIETVRHREGDRVDAGAVLLQLQANEPRAAVDAAAAQLVQAEAVLAKLEDGATPEQLGQAEAAADAASARLRLVASGARDEEIAAARAAADAARVQRDAAQRDSARLQHLLAEEAVSRQQADQARSAAGAAAALARQAEERVDALASGARPEEIAMARADAARAQAALDEVRTGARDEDRVQARAAVDAARANLARAQTAVDETRIVAPIAGLIESLDLRVGDLVRPGPLVRIVDPEDLEVTIYVGAAVLGRLDVGEAVTLTADAFAKSETFQATIDHIASEGEFTPRNLQTGEERLQQVFGVKLRLDSHGGKLRAGMTVTAHLPPAP